MYSIRSPAGAKIACNGTVGWDAGKTGVSLDVGRVGREGKGGEVVLMEEEGSWELVKVKYFWKDLQHTAKTWKLDHMTSEAGRMMLIMWQNLTGWQNTGICEIAAFTEKTYRPTRTSWNSTFQPSYTLAKTKWRFV